MESMTNEEIHSRYIRSLMAREIVGYRKSWQRSAQAGFPVPEQQKIVMLRAMRNSFGRIDLHFRRHHDAFVADDPTPLMKYPPGFAGHA